MKSNDALFQILPTTGRGAEALARRHGYKNLASLARSLPRNANVLDVGAGVSHLGREVAFLRPDVHWINLDFGYHDKRILNEAKKDAPPNLKFVVGDVTRLEEFVKQSSMDTAFSYFLFPHLSTYDPKMALTAARQVYASVKPGGVIAIGPSFSPRLSPAIILGKSWRVIKDERLSADTYSYEVFRQTQLPAYSRYIRRAFNAAAFEVFGTSRYLKGASILSQQIYNPYTQTYVSAYSPAAVPLVGKVLLGTIKRLIWRYEPYDRPYSQ